MEQLKCHLREGRHEYQLYSHIHVRFLSCVISFIVLPTLPSPSSAVLRKFPIQTALAGQSGGGCASRVSRPLREWADDLEPSENQASLLAAKFVRFSATWGYVARRFYSLSHNSFVKYIFFLVHCFEASFLDSAQHYSHDGRRNGSLSTTELKKYKMRAMFT